MATEADPPPGPDSRPVALPLAALGVVYGDIGTSPLYAIRECFFGLHAVAATDANVLGVLSLVIWSLLLVISVKYLTFILRADHDGEGGILALMELAVRRLNGTGRKIAVGLGLFGAALLYGDGMITPAISVLSAMEGLRIAPDAFQAYVLPLTIGILTALFLLQRLGTGGIGRLFGPVMLVWFVVLGLGGANAIAAQPGVLAAFNPLEALSFFRSSGVQALTILGIVFLVVTGGEALYADLGHFGRAPVQRSWYGIVLPALLLNYLGQGALILSRSGELSNPFYELYPAWALYPAVVLATAATVIASQAIISGVFSLTFQGIQLGYLPRLKTLHTSSQQRGQIYVPAMNWLLLAATVGLVLGFRESGNLAGAYGIAIAATMTLTSILYLVVARHRFQWSLPAVAAAGLAFLTIDSSYLVANLGKIPSGGWFPLVVAAAMVLVMSTWLRGRRIEGRLARDRAEPLAEFLANRGGSYRRVPGEAVYLARNEHGTPHLFERNIRHNRSLHRSIVVYTAKVVKRPYTDREERLKVREIRDDLHRVIAYYGFMERIDVPRDLAEACHRYGLTLDLDRITYFVGDEIALARQDVGLPRWRAWLYAIMQRNAERGTRDFNLPPAQVIEIGTQVPI